MPSDPFSGDDSSAANDATLAAAIQTAVAVVMGEGSAELLRDAVPARLADRLLPGIDRSRGEVEGLRRREHELSALYASARQLVGLGDADAVLTRLVERAHEMLGADITYLSEFDRDTRELRVRTTYGAVSASFRQLIVPPGRGLVSVIAETGIPQAVSRYDDYAADRHDPGVDDAVTAEGIVSMLGVPLHADEGMLGVLFVAMRQERSFLPEQIALLSALADHASVVLQSAGALRSLRRSEEASRAALDQLSAHVAERERANTVHQQLVHAVLDGGGFAPVAATLEATLGRPACIVDEQGELRAAAGDIERLRTAWNSGRLRAAVAESRGSGHAIGVQSDGQEVLVAALASGSSLYGAVLIDRADALGAVDRRTLERAAQVGALLALSEEAQAEAARRQQVDLVAELLTATPDRRADLAARTRRLGLDIRHLDGLVAIGVQGERRADAVKLLARRFEGMGLAGERDGVVVLVAAASDEMTVPAALRAELEAALEVPVLAVGVPAAAVADERRTDAHRADGVPLRFEQARRALRLLEAIGVESGAVSVDELLPYAAVLDTDQRALEAFLDGTIGAVRRYDADRGTELLATLHAFVSNGASPTRTARALTFHPNTILQRLERLDQVLGKGWREDESLFRISLAIRLDGLRRRLASR
ncbi:helix-turn-helix domain-containing protein [Agrococcus sp. Marseille-P2731]|uniref:helix-turn-helix domain-containing protein n=1 Tax=Agrococcus sp. Marseille-P2731 TaxID=1841862 RepID=UPI000B1C5D15|nr:GAF domain-containing protein [Agrococcus sp. Marseille-P2731]